MTDMLAYAAHLPVAQYAPGQILIHEDRVGGGLWILESGMLQVRKGDTPVNTIVEPGAIVGEISVLLGTPHGASVEAIEPTRTRYAENGKEFLLGNPEITRLIAVGLAERLNYVNSYFADLKHQYGDAPGLSMVGTILSRLAQRQDASAQSGSARDPDPEY